MRSTISGKPLAAAAAGIAGTAIAVGQVLGRVSGSRGAERRRILPGDHLISAPNVITNHAATLPAPPDAVWPWLTQTGWHRAGWYTPRWVDRLLFPQNWASADTLDHELVRDLSCGDTIPDGPPGTAEFVVERVEPGRLLVLHSTTHVPQSWQQRTGARIDWVWTFALEPEGAGHSRLLIRTVARTAPWWLTVAYTVVLVPADHIMATGMLHGLARRVAARGGATPPPSPGAAIQGRSHVHLRKEP